MLTNFFSNTKPVNSVFIITLFMCYMSIGFFTGEIASLNFGLFFWFLVLFGFVNFVNSRNDLTFDNSFFFLFFVILIGCFPSTIKIDSFFYSNLILVIYVRRVYSLQSSKNISKKLFDSGLWIGISFLIEPFSLIFIAMTYLAILLHQHVDYRKLLIPVLGFLSPVILSFTYFFWYEELDRFYALFYWYTSYDFSFYNSFSFQLLFGIVFLLIFLSFLLKTPKALSVKNTFRKNWILLCFHMLLACALLVFIKNRNGTEILYILFPAAIIIANGFELFRKKWFADIIMLLIFLVSLIPLLIH